MRQRGVERADWIGVERSDRIRVEREDQNGERIVYKSE